MLRIELLAALIPPHVAARTHDRIPGVLVLPVPGDSAACTVVHWDAAYPIDSPLSPTQLWGALQHLFGYQTTLDAADRWNVALVQEAEVWPHLYVTERRPLPRYLDKAPSLATLDTRTRYLHESSLVQGGRK